MDDRILLVDLSAGSVESFVPDGGLRRSWIGGRGLAGCFLEPLCTLPWDDPGMPLILMTGPLAGTRAPTSGRMCVMSISPLTGTVGDTSVGGDLAFALRRAGFLGAVITGRAPRPTGLEIAGGRAGLVDASPLEGMDVAEATARLSGTGRSVILTGPAARHGVLFACAVADGSHAAGRNGIGMAFAARNLRFVTAEGDRSVQVADPRGLDAACAEIGRLLDASPVIMGRFGLHNMGTPALYDLMHARGMMPTANFRRTRFDAAPGMNAPAMGRLWETRRSGCRGCRIQCKRVTAEGLHMPEFESLSHFSALVENTDLAAAVEANRLCNLLGMDTISAASTIACRSEMEGSPPGPGVLLDLLRRIGTGLEPGLARGSLRYASSLGRPGLSMSVKGLELPAYDPRGAYGMALAYAVSSRGGCHLRAYPVSHEILRRPVATERLSFSGKARIVKIAEDANAAIDSLCACRFSFFGATLEEYAKALSAVAGETLDAQDLLDAGERICLRDRAINAANGFTEADDDLPARFFEEPGTGTDWMQVPPIPRQEFLEARQRYYSVRGLDERGAPACRAGG